MRAGAALALLRDEWASVLDEVRAQSPAAWLTCADWQPVALDDGAQLTCAAPGGGVADDDAHADAATALQDSIAALTPLRVTVRAVPAGAGAGHASTGNGRTSTDNGKTSQNRGRTPDAIEVLPVLPVLRGIFKNALLEYSPPIGDGDADDDIGADGPSSAGNTGRTSDRRGGRYLWRVQRIGHAGDVRHVRVVMSEAAAQRQADKWAEWDSTASTRITRSIFRVEWEAGE